MVIIQYNTMAMSKKTPTLFIQPRRKTLRSAQKHGLPSNNNFDPQNSQKVIDQIQNQIEHHETNNASKTTYPMQQDIKIEGEPIADKSSQAKSQNQMQIKSKKSLSINNHPLSQRSPQLSRDLNDNSLEEKIKSKDEAQQKQKRLLTPPPKLTNRLSNRQHQNSNFNISRRSYKLKKRESHLVPYRRCQDPFQQKIVTLMNKICQKKGYQKDIDTFGQKIQRLSKKQLYNPFVISGIKTILNLLQRNSQLNITCISKLKNQVNNLGQKILTQLGKTDQYETIIIEENKVDPDIAKPKMMRRIYKMLLQSENYEFQKARNRSVFICEQFFQRCNNQAREDDILLFLRESKFLTF